MRHPIKYFLKNWLLHSVLFWLVISLYFTGYILYTKITVGDYLFYPNGEPVPVSDRIWQLVINYQSALLIIVSLFVIQLNVQWFFRKKVTIFIVSSLLTGVVISLLAMLSYRLWHHIYRYEVSFVFVSAGYAFLYPYLVDFIRKLFKKAALYQQSKAELDALKAQIHPHFLFNTLNSLYGMALEEKAVKTAAGIEQLSGMMRYVLEQAQYERVPVEHELRFIEQYIQLQRTRVPENINRRITADINYDGEPVTIAPLILLPLIENAFRHGIQPGQDCFLRLELRIQQGALNLQLSNSIVPATPGTGKGLPQVIQRLKWLYPGRHQFTTHAAPSSFTTTLTMRLI